MFVPILIPTGSDHDRSKVPYATFGLIGINTLIYLCGLLMDQQEDMLRSVGFIAAHPLPHQFLTHMFFHGGLMHLAGNMAYLWFAGSDLEDALGPAKFLIVYFLGGF